jgi:type IV pilus assembly protein PilB
MKTSSAPIREEADSTGEGVVDTLVARQIISSANVAQAKAAQFGVEYVNLAEMRLTDEVDCGAAAHRQEIQRGAPVPARQQVTVAMSDPSDLDTLDSLRMLLNLEVEPRVASPDDIESAIGKYYGAKEDSVSKMIQDITEGEIQISTLAVGRWPRMTDRWWTRTRRSSSW